MRVTVKKGADITALGLVLNTPNDRADTVEMGGLARAGSS
jgi:hypothetical protein